jgi:hypothetical protein
MDNDLQKNSWNEFESEHAKRDRRISHKQQREWADALISCLPDSASYREACTSQARLKEQALLNQWVADWLKAQQFDKRTGLQP